jgi:hypothetical protein
MDDVRKVPAGEGRTVYDEYRRAGAGFRVRLPMPGLTDGW